MWMHSEREAGRRFNLEGVYISRALDTLSPELYIASHLLRRVTRNKKRVNRREIYLAKALLEYAAATVGPIEEEDWK